MRIIYMNKSTYWYSAPRSLLKVGGGVLFRRSYDVITGAAANCGRSEMKYLI